MTMTSPFRPNGPSAPSGTYLLRMLHRLALLLLAGLFVSSTLGCGAADRAANKGTSAEETTLQFASNSGWHATETGMTPVAPQAVSATASNVPLSDPAGAIPLATLRSLPDRGIVIVATIFPPGPGENAFPNRSLPFNLSDADVRSGYEGQVNKDVPEYLILGHTKGYSLDVRVYFGRQHPTSDQLSGATNELSRLRVPDYSTVVNRASKLTSRY